MMTHAQTVRAAAAKLHANGKTYTQIGAELNVSAQTAYRWLNPEYAARNREASRAAKERRRTKCPHCGQPVSYDRPNEPCLTCTRDQDYGERTRRIADAWNQGDLARVIAEREGMTLHGVLSLTAYLRNHGQYDIARRHRSRRELWDHIARRRNDDHAKSREIADELGTTPANINSMIRAMRKAGIHVE
jgi:DNA-binding MarR family transcriptional regulator